MTSFSLQSSHELLGSVFQVTVILEDVSHRSFAEQVIAQAVHESKAFERRYSRFMEDNELAELNARVGEWFEVNQELYDLVEWGVQLNLVSNGAFNLTVKSVLEGWGYDAAYSLQESSPGQVGTVELDPGLLRVRATAPLDLGALGKGYVLDRWVERLSSFSNFCVNAGGDLWAQGVRVDGLPWTALFEHPTDPTQAIGTVEVDGFALACSSPSRRQWRDRHHLVDARTETPAGNMLAVYTQAETGFLADAYATTLFVMGYEAARLAVEDFPVEAMLVSSRGEIFQTPRFQGILFQSESA